MHKSLRAEIEIDAPAHLVWAILSELNAYPSWNPFITRIAGQLEPGEKLQVRIEPPGGTAMTFRPKVLVAEPNREVRWLGHLIVPGLFDGEHRLAVEAISNGRSRFVQEERFTGLLVPLLAGSLDRNTLPGFKAMNEALKTRAEAAVGSA